MLRADTVLVPLSLAQRADLLMAWAARLADAAAPEAPDAAPEAAHAVDVHVLHVLPVPAYASIRALFDTLADRHDDLHEEVAEELQADPHWSGPHRTVRRVQRRGADEAAEILRYAGESDAGLIVLGTRGHRDLRHAGLGGVSGDVLRGASCPVLTVPLPDEDDAPVAPPPVRHVLVPVDFSAHAEQAVPVACALAARFGARLSLLFVAEERTVVMFSDTGLPSVQTLKVDAEIADRASEALAQLHRATCTTAEGRAGGHAEAACHVRAGHPAREILRFAEDEGVDLIVQSARGADHHALFDLGSVAERTVRGAPCPVLTLKAPAGAE